MKSQIKPIKQAIEMFGGIKGLASQIGCHYYTVARWIADADKTYHCTCSPKYALKIERATGGRVRQVDIYCN